MLCPLPYPVHEDMLNKVLPCALVAAATAALVPPAHAADVLATHLAPMQIQVPTGMSYVVAGDKAVLDVMTGGYLLCANAALDNEEGERTNLVFKPHRKGWTMPTAHDVRAMSYNAGVLRVNRTAQGSSPGSTMVCHQRAADGRLLQGPFSPWADPIFTHSFDLHPGLQAINWRVPWESGPSMARIEENNTIPEAPTDACNFDPQEVISYPWSGHYPQLAEPTLCAAATGVRPGNSDQPYGIRATTMWTKVEKNTAGRDEHFVYVARIDARFGENGTPPNGAFPAQGQQVTQDAPGYLDIRIQDAFNHEALDASGGKWCFHDELPDELDATLCDEVPVKGNLDGPLKTRIALDNGEARSRYLVLIRPFLPAPTVPQQGQPLAAVAVFAPPLVSSEFQGNQFIGDDVIFGFYGPNEVFSWAQP